MRWALGAIFMASLVSVPAVSAHQLVATVGYANSSAPKLGEGVPDDVILAGGGYAFGTRVDIQRKMFWFGPSFAFWNNLTGDPSSDINSSYLQAEFGARISARTRTIPAFYGGIGAGYTFSHCEFAPKYYGEPKETYDGEFPTGSLHVGVKTPSRSTGIGVLGELGYSFGLDRARGRNAVGPARAFLVQIGFALDILTSP